MSVFGAFWGVIVFAFAATWGPFIINNYYPGLSYDADMANEFFGAANVPRKVMNLQVASIKRGDIVRVMYADGQIYDFETSADCSPQASFSCPFSGNGTRRAFVEDSAAPSSAALTLSKVKNDNRKCTGGGAGSNSVQVQTGCWGSTAWLDSQSNWNIIGGWISTGLINIQYTLQSVFSRQCP